MKHLFSFSYFFIAFIIMFSGQLQAQTAENSNDTQRLEQINRMKAIASDSTSVKLNKEDLLKETGAKIEYVTIDEKVKAKSGGTATKQPVNNESDAEKMYINDKLVSNNSGTENTNQNYQISENEQNNTYQDENRTAKQTYVSDNLPVQSYTAGNRPVRSSAEFASLKEERQEKIINRKRHYYPPRPRYYLR